MDARFVAIFEQAASGTDGVLRRPGAAGLEMLLSEFGKSSEDISSAMQARGWDESHDVNMADFHALCVSLGCGDDDNDEEGDALASLVDAIARRANAGEFPLVRPEECAGEAERDAAASWAAFVMKTEYVELQSFIDARKAAFFRDACEDADVPPPVREARWARDSYYTHVREFYVAKFADSGKLSHRFEFGVFIPMVQPSSLPCEQKRAAAVAVMKELTSADVAVFDAQLHHMWRGIRSSVEGVVEDVHGVCSKFLIQQYYDIMEDVVLSRRKADAAGALASAAAAPRPAVRPEESTEGICLDAKNALLAGRSARDLEEVDRAVATAWTDRCSTIPASYRAALPKVPPSEFLQETYYLILQNMTAKGQFEDAGRDLEMALPLAEPVVSPDESTEGMPMEAKQALLAGRSAEELEEVNVSVALAWADRRAAFPASLRAALPADAPREFFQEQYYVILKGMMERRGFADATDGALLELDTPLPMVQPDESTEGLSVTVKEALVAGRSREDFDAVGQALATAWADCCRAIPAALRAALPEDPPADFCKEQYYLILKSMTESGMFETKRGAGSLQAPGAASLILNSACGAASSRPASKARRIEGSRLSHGELGVDGVLGDLSVEVRTAAPQADAAEYIGSIAVYADGGVDGYFVYEGYVLAHDDKPRAVGKGDAGKSPSKRKASAPEKTTMAMDVLVMDRTGPLILTLWDDAVKQFLAEVAAKQTGARRGGRAEQQQKPIIRVTNVRVSSLSSSDWNGAMVTPIRTLHTSSARSPLMPVTKVMALVTASSPFMAPGRAYEVPARGVCVDFLGLKDRLEAPFRGTFSGVVTSVQDMGATVAGSPKRVFCLVDPAGAFIQCCAVGHNAGSRALADGMRAVVYHGTGRGPIGSAPGMLYLLKDALLMPVTQVDVVPEPTIEIAIK